jgi:hypothetical protein
VPSRNERAAGRPEASPDEMLAETLFKTLPAALPKEAGKAMYEDP